MPKAYTVEQQSVAQAAHHAEVYLIEADLASGVQRYTTAGASLPASFYDPGSRSVSWQGGVSPTWLGELRDTEADEAVGIIVRLPGLSSSQISLAMLEPVQGRRLSIWTAILDPTAQYALVGTPIKDNDYLIDVIYPEERDGKRELVIECETEDARFLRANTLRLTDRDHQRRFPGDTICRWTAQTERAVPWGRQ